MKNRTVVVVQCRYNSSRLCGKALFPLAGVPMLVFLLRRLSDGLQESDYRIVLATSTNQLDQAVVRWGASEDVEVLLGDEDDVLKRYIKCMEKYGGDTVVRVTADNPLTCPEQLDLIVRDYLAAGLDYLQPKNLPLGAGVDVFSFSVLKELDREVLNPAEREHINLHILEHQNKFKSGVKEITGKVARPDLNMTVDTMEDWQRVSSLFKSNEIKPWKISLPEAIKRMDSNPV